MMSISSATKLFYKFGGVGKSPEDLLTAKPTRSQLNEAILVALNNGIDEDLIYDAKDAIIQYFTNNP